MNQSSCLAIGRPQYRFKTSRISSLTQKGKWCCTPGPPILVSQQSKPQSLRSFTVPWTVVESVSTKHTKHNNFNKQEKSDRHFCEGLRGLLENISEQTAP
ncbi:hypothetical protein XENOCAPTIV_009708 [Xenoophorus captivus]|uniref:Uncharacterized protein n=1 Tax=Xenoophorus captivus TaxID=1517983 RepID=A0ABV0QQW4_9TELE